jgi:hypothetical protein
VQTHEPSCSATRGAALTRRASAQALHCSCTGQQTRTSLPGDCAASAAPSSTWRARWLHRTTVCSSACAAPSRSSLMPSAAPSDTSACMTIVFGVLGFD